MYTRGHLKEQGEAGRAGGRWSGGSSSSTGPPKWEDDEESACRAYIRATYATYLTSYDGILRSMRA